VNNDTPDIPLKQCTMCGMCLPATTDYFTPHKECEYGLNPRCRSCQYLIRHGLLVVYKFTPREGCKWCSVCKQQKPYSEFFRSSSNKDGFNSRCKRCYADSLGYTRQYRKPINDVIPKDMKECLTCHNVYPKTEMYFRSSGKKGLRHECRECERQRQREEYWENPELFRAKAVEYSEKHRKELAAKAKERYWANPEKYRRLRREYYVLHPEREKQVRQRYYQTHTDEMRERARNWYWENRERSLARGKEWRQQNHARLLTLYRERYWNDPEKAREYTRQYNKTERGKLNRTASRQRRAARERSLPDTFTIDDWQRALEYFDGRCAICGRLPGFWFTIAADHWIALSDPRPDNPGTVATNVIPLCHSKKGVPVGEPSCNQNKRSKDPEEWLIERYGKRKAKQILDRIKAYFEWVERD
jgi:hypothetical protein